MNYEPIYLPLSRRASLVRGYRDEFSDEVAQGRPRNLTFETAMRLRALWLTGKDVKELADRYCGGRIETVARIVSGIAFMTPDRADLSTFRQVVADFYDALGQCTFQPHNAAASHVLFPLEAFARGEFKGAGSLPADGWDDDYVPKPKAEKSVKPKRRPRDEDSDVEDGVEDEDADGYEAEERPRKKKRKTQMELVIEALEEENDQPLLAMIAKYRDKQWSAGVSPRDWFNLKLHKPLPGGCPAVACRSTDIYWNAASKDYQCCACSGHTSPPPAPKPAEPLDDMLA